MDHQEPLLSGIFGFLGLKDLTWIRAEGLSRGGDARETAMSAARAEIAALSF